MTDHRVEDGPASSADWFAAVEPIPGWLTRDQATVLREEVRALGDGPLVVEIGSHQGRSTVALAGARPDVRVIAIDPFVSRHRLGGPDFGGAQTRLSLLANLERAGVGDRVEVRASTSRAEFARWHGSVDLVYVDGKHDAFSTRADLRWGERLAPGGRLIVHDGFSSIGVTLALLPLALSPTWRYLDRTGSLVRFERARPRPSDRLAILAQLPWFARNVAIKVLLRFRLRAVAARFGHTGPADPF